MLCAVLAGLIGAVVVACNVNAIGRPCVNPVGADAGVPGTQLSSPALECPSRLCLLQPPTESSMIDGGLASGARATCTASCESNDDCDAETKLFCRAGFVCAVAVTTGPFCCRKMCVCRDDLQAGINRDPVDGGVILPTSCDIRKNPSSTCPNLHR